LKDFERIGATLKKEIWSWRIDTMPLFEKACLKN